MIIAAINKSRYSLNTGASCNLPYILQEQRIANTKYSTYQRYQEAESIICKVPTHTHKATIIYVFYQQLLSQNQISSLEDSFEYSSSYQISFHSMYQTTLSVYLSPQHEYSVLVFHLSDVQ